MKKRFLTIPLALALLALTACGPKEGADGGKPSGGQVPALPDKAAEALTDQGFEAVEPAEPPQRTIEELIQAVKDGEPMTDGTGAPYASMVTPEDGILPSLGGAALAGGETVAFSDEPWEDKTVVAEDWKAQLSEEERAGFEEMEAMTEEDWQAMIAETEAMVEEFESMDDLEGMEDGWEGDYEDFPGPEGFEMPDMDELDIPDEYRQYLLEGFGGIG